MSRARRWIVGFFAVVIGFGCAAAQAQTQKTYTIVSLLDYSGPFANRGKPVEQMQRLLVDWYNETRGVKAGIKLDFKPVDTGYDQARTVQVYERALEDKSLVGVVTFGSPNVIALQNRLSQDKIPAVHGGPSYSLMKPGNWKETRPLRIAFVTFDGSSGRDWAQGLAGKIKGMNAEIVLTEFVSPRALDVTANAAHIEDAKPDIVYLATTDQLQPALLKELKANKFDMTKIVNSQHEGLGLLELLGVAKDVYEGTWEVTSENYADQTTKAYEIYQSRQAKYTTRWSADTLLHFPSVMVLLDAIERAAIKAGPGGTVTGETVFAEMRSGEFDGYGLLGKIKFDIDKDPTQGAEAVVMLQQKGGKIIRVSDFLPLEK